MASEAMQAVNDFLKAADTYYLATVEGDQPRVRPFGTINIFEDKLYLLTAKEKHVAKQIAANPKVELSATSKDGSHWIRVSATLVEDPNIAAQTSMLDAYPSLKSMYTAGDSNTALYYLKDAVATLYSFTEAPKVCQF
ncbi:NimC/NimA family protein [Lachnospiraceae bacterium TWA4]|nr:NimC/NimA family protein [Lachnospiraceae bacterium TWA4]